jgi:hypothetical protein
MIGTTRISINQKSLLELIFLLSVNSRAKWNIDPMLIIELKARITPIVIASKKNGKGRR